MEWWFNQYNYHLVLFTTELVCKNKYSCKYKAWSILCPREIIIRVNVLHMCICTLEEDMEMKHSYSQHLILFTRKLVCTYKYLCKYKEWSIIYPRKRIIRANVLQIHIFTLEVDIEMNHPYNQHLVLFKTEMVCTNKYSYKHKIWSMLCPKEIFCANVLQMCICTHEEDIEINYLYNQHLILFKTKLVCTNK